MSPAVSALRRCAASIAGREAEAPARIEEIRHAKEEGVDFFFLHSPVEILVTESGDVRAVRLQKMELGEADERGRRKPVPLDEFIELECDTVIYALGTKPNPIIGQATPGLALNKWGNIAADDDTQSTNMPGVFAGGDIVTGGATVILAMSAGRRAAKSIAAWLRLNKTKWPITAQDADDFVAGKLASPIEEDGVAHCPKCHQPLEGSEEYICCAGSELQWRCDDCAKVSEGFAFPYGMCPHCGGKLQPLDRAGVNDEAGLAAIRTAFEIELGGRAFYARAAKETSDPTLQELFLSFAAMEEEHMTTLANRYHVAIPQATEGFHLGTAAIMAGVKGRIGDPTTLFEAAIEFERRAAAFFKTRVGETPDGSVERQLYRELAAEEDEHVSVLQTEFARWKEGKRGLLT